MARKKDEYIRKGFETRLPGKPSKTHEKYVGITLTMLMSDAWHNLPGAAKNMYLYMRLQYDGNNENGFYFNRSLWAKKYKLFSNDNTFQRNLKKLVENGFIDIKESGRTTRTKSIYGFSDRWQEIPAKEKRDMTKQNNARNKDD